MTSWEFAQKMDISYHTVMRWLKFGIVPGAVKAENNRDWVVPDEALKMKRPAPGPRPKKGVGVVRTKEESRLVQELKTELADSNKRHMELMEKYAGATGRIDKLQREFEHAKGFAKIQENHIEDFERQIEDLKGDLALAEAHIKTLEGSLAAETANYELYRRLYLEEKSKYDQLALTTGGLTPSKEELCQNQKISSSSTPSTESTRP